MVRKKGKSVSFDTMVKFFIHQYKIPTKRDVEKLMARMDRLERMIKSASGPATRRASGSATAAGSAAAERSAVTASDTVLDIIKSSKGGVDFSEIHDRTGYGEKKLRNIIFRLNKIGKITRVSRGVYIAA